MKFIWWNVIVLIAAAVLVGEVALISYALAQTPGVGAPPPGMAWAATNDGWIAASTSYVCQNNGAVLNFILHWGWGILGIPFAASIMGNFRSKLSPSMNAVLDAVGGDVATALKAKAVTAAVVNGAAPAAQPVPPTPKP